MRATTILILISLLISSPGPAQSQAGPVGAKRLQSVNICTTAPSATEVLTYDGTDWCPAAGGGGDLVDDTSPQLGGDLDPQAYGIGTNTAALGDGSNATFTLNVDLSGTDFDLNFDATDACFGMGGTDVLCISNDGTDGLVVLENDVAQGALNQVLRLQDSTGSHQLNLGVDSSRAWISPSGASNKLAIGPDAVHWQFTFAGAAGTFDAGGAGGARLAYSATWPKPTIYTNVDADTGFGVIAAGISGVTGNSLESARFESVASTVNSWHFKSSATGADLIVLPQGTDTNIGIDIQGKGTGIIAASTNVGAAPPATCTPSGIPFLDTDESDDTNCATTADNSLCLCVAADTWVSLENN